MLLALVGILTAALACGGVPREPTGLGDGRGTGGQAGGGGSAQALIGTWRNVFIIRLEQDVQTSTTTWLFRADLTCQQTIVSESLAEGFPRTTVRDCLYAVVNTDVRVLYQGSAAPVVFSFGFVGLDPNRLVLSGIEFQRVG